MALCVVGNGKCGQSVWSWQARRVSTYLEYIRSTPFPVLRTLGTETCRGTNARITPTRRLRPWFSDPGLRLFTLISINTSIGFSTPSSFRPPNDQYHRAAYPTVLVNPSIQRRKKKEKEKKKGEEAIAYAKTPRRPLPHQQRPRLHGSPPETSPCPNPSPPRPRPSPASS